MRFYTSYYYQVRNFPKNLIGFSTAIWPPKYIPLGDKGPNGVICIDCPPLKPGKECQGLCNGSCNPKQPMSCDFLQVYRNQLLKINFQKFISNIETITNKIKNEEKLDDVDVAFLVFEAPDNKCSERLPIQQWLQFNGIEVSEWNKNSGKIGF